VSTLVLDSEENLVYMENSSSGTAALRVARQEDTASLHAVRRDSRYPNKSVTSPSILAASCTPLERET
jgi:hypothetical protein